MSGAAKLLFTDPYKIRGVKRHASQDEIRTAYRNLAKEHHPDLNPGDTQSAERFKAISAANELLSDARKRSRFDRGEIDAAGQEQTPRSSYRDHAEEPAGRRHSRGEAHSNGWNQDDLRDVFGSMFLGDGGPSSRSSVRGQDEHYVLTTALVQPFG